MRGGSYLDTAWGLRASRVQPADPERATNTTGFRIVIEGGDMTRDVLIDALREVYDPCCADRGISIVDMGVVEDVRVDGSHVDVDLVLTTGWCPFVVSMSTAIPEALTAHRRRRDRRRQGRLGSRLDDGSPVGVGTREARDAAGGAGALSRGKERCLMVDAFVFDCVCHIFNFDKKNALGPPGELFDEHLYAFHQLLTREGETVLSRDEFFKEWSVDEIYDMVIEGSDTDMIVAQPLPLTDLFHDGLSAWEKCAEMAAKHPDKAVFWGSVNPLEGKKALDLMTRQVEDHGAKAFKFYNVRYDYGQPFPWRMDDPRIAFPIFEHAQELGVNLIGVHKGVPLGPQPIEHTRTFDMDGAAANFPDINFVIFHVGLPWLDEVLWQIVRYPNLYASIAATVNFISRQPRVFAEMLGKMMWWCGEDKIIYGGESPIWHPQWALEEFWNFELPRDIVEERGYPQLTDQAKRKILGGNLARLHGIEVPA